MLRKMFLVSPEYLHTVTRSTSLPPPTPNMVGAGKKPIKKRRRRRMAVKKKDTARSDYEKWLKVRDNLREADVEKKREIQTVANFLKQVLPPSVS